jgi:uncharacterized protein YceK
MQRRARLGLAVLAVVLGIAGCGSVNSSAESPQPAGKSPSAIARMVCTEKAAGEIAQVVAAKASRPRWCINPLNTQVSYIQAFDRQEGLAGVPNWLYLTGTLAQLQQAWRRYGVPQAEILPAGSMVGHGDYAFIIDQHGHIRQELGFDTGPGTQATKSSFAAELTDAARQLLGHP